MRSEVYRTQSESQEEKVKMKKKEKSIFPKNWRGQKKKNW